MQAVRTLPTSFKENKTQKEKKRLRKPGPAVSGNGYNGQWGVTFSQFVWLIGLWLVSARKN
eukprot:1153113-Pelagomonas_calceolata.AAC.1